MGWTQELCLKQLGSFDTIVNVSNYCKSVFDRLCPELRYKSFSVINTYNVEEIKQKGRILNNLYNNSKDIHLVTVSRVEIRFKRTDRIVEVCRRLVSEGYSNFDWTVVGDGGAFKILSDKVKEYDLDGVLDFVGHKDNPYPYMAQADAFILCSDYEGYPMTIKESQILETPTFVTGFGSAAEVVANYQQGEICENSTEGLFEMVKSILDNPEKLKSYRKTLAQAPVTNQEAIRQFSSLIK